MADGICQECNDWKPCIPPEHFTYPEIRWCPYQCIWLLRFSEILQAGYWPLEYDDNTGDDPSMHGSPFEKAVIVIAEICQRLTKCGKDGKILKYAVLSNNRNGMMLQQIMDTLEPEAYEALMYVKGINRKTMTYSQWERNRKYKGYANVTMPGK